MLYFTSHANKRGFSRLRLLSVGLLIALMGLWWLDHCYPPVLVRAEQYSTQVLDEQGDLLRTFTNADQHWRLALTLDRVDPLFIALLLAYEDQRYWWHPGVDPVALLRAIGQWVQHGRVVSGASTLTMQTARLLQPRPRTVTNKLKEMLRALQLEWHFDKREILTLYLNLAPYGGNLQGLRSAALAYFGKEPARLTPAQAALLVVLPQAPSRLRPDRYPQRAAIARRKVLLRGAQQQILSVEQIREALQQAVPTQRRVLPFHAPHLAQYLRRIEPDRGSYLTTLQRSLQIPLEQLAQATLHDLADEANMALMVVEHGVHKVRAYVGSGDFFATRRAGQMDLARALRSPGSTLKPFIYGLGFDDLIIHPQTLINDIPRRFGAYRPSNFRNTYRGQVSIREALQQSLNVPAVAVLERIGPGRLAARLRRVGVTLHWSGTQSQPGLPMALGGVGTRLVDLMTLYTALANGGQSAALRYLQEIPEQQKQFLLSARSSAYLKAILTTTPRPALTIPAANQRQAAAIAYKTGTSYGFRDAWALGFNHKYTVGVWVGRPDGAPSPERYGRNTAAPLLFQVFDMLPERESTPELEQLQDAQSVARIPDRLRFFERPEASAKHRHGQPLSISFPPDGATVELSSPGADHSAQALPLIAQGGDKPLRWLVNQELLVQPPHRTKVFWTPDGAGLARITVIDSSGAAASAEVWLQYPTP